MYLLRNGAIDHPCDFAVGRAHDLGGILVGVGWTFDDGVQGVYFVRACHQEEHVAGGIQNGRSGGGLGTETGMTNRCVSCSDGWCGKSEAV